MRNEITREAIINVLKERNFNALPNDVIKNGVVLNGIIIKNDTKCAPVMYVENYVKNYDSAEEVAEAIIQDYEKCLDPGIDISHYSDSEWVLSHLYIGLQKTSTENLIKRNSELDSIEEYIYIRDIIDGGFTSAKLTDGLMQSLKISSEEVWQSAEINTFSPEEFVIKSMSQVVSEIMGTEISEADGPEMYIVSNSNMSRGSVQVLNKSALRNYFGDSINRIVVIPSSIHECIIVTLEGTGLEVSDLNNMINEVNRYHVAEHEQLGNHAYILDI